MKLTLEKKYYSKPDLLLKKVTRDSVILPKLIGETFKIHNGKTFDEITITENMLGHKFGEFSFTRVRHVFKKKKKKETLIKKNN